MKQISIVDMFVSATDKTQSIYSRSVVSPRSSFVLGKFKWIWPTGQKLFALRHPHCFFTSCCVSWNGHGAMGTPVIAIQVEINRVIYAMLSRMQWCAEVSSAFDVEQESGKKQNLSATPVIKTTERKAASEAERQLKLLFPCLTNHPQW